MCRNKEIGKVQRLRCERINEREAEEMPSAEQEEVKARRAGTDNRTGPGTDTVFGNKKWRLQGFFV